MDINLTEEKALDLLIRRAGANEEIIRLMNEVKPYVFVGLEEAREIHMSEKGFFAVCEALSIPYTIKDFGTKDYKYKAEAHRELFAQDYRLFCLFNPEEEKGVKNE